MKNLKILVPVDFSEPSKAALRAAGQWARSLGGKVAAMHAYEPRTDLDGFHFYGPETMSGNLVSIETGVRRLLDDWVGQAVDSEHVAESIFREGAPALSIARAAMDHDLVILSSHGRSGFSRLLLGSVTDKVIRLTPTPVLVVPGQPTRESIKRILVPTDLSPNSVVALTAALELAAASGATLELLHVYRAGDLATADTTSLEKQVRDFAQSHGAGGGEVTVTALVTGTSVHAAIHDFVHDKPCDLIVMSTVGKSNLDRQLLGSTPSQVVRHVATPILLVNPPERAESKKTALA